METYLVGGAVRDELLDLPVRERDWVVIGATPEEMLKRGFKQVGKEFPVFLHPQTGEEYALARTERKTGPGYTGFTVHAGTDVTLEEDLERRDLTINAMAKAPDGTIIDPFGGQEHLREGLLCHVSSAFVEDPVRVLRVARFAARFSRRGFQLSQETNALMRSMVESGEVDQLVPERVWSEMARALQEDQPSRFFEVLRGCGALAKLFPEIDRLFGVPQPTKHHPEIDTGIHTLMVLEQSVRLSGDPQIRVAALVHDLGKAETAPDKLPSHDGHEQRSVELINDLCARYKIPNSFRDLAVMVARYHTHCHRAQELRPTTLLDILEALDALRRPERFEAFLVACEADARGRGGMEDRLYPQAQYFRDALAAANKVTAGPLLKQGIQGEAVGRRLRQLRVEAIRALKT